MAGGTWDPSVLFSFLPLLCPTGCLVFHSPLGSQISLIRGGHPTRPSLSAPAFARFVLSHFSDSELAKLGQAASLPGPSPSTNPRAARLLLLPGAYFFSLLSLSRVWRVIGRGFAGWYWPPWSLRSVGGLLLNR
jgi:hypothetical protein